MSLKARAKPLTAADNETGEVRREGEKKGAGGGPLVALLLHLLLPFFTCQRLSQSPQTWKTEVFSLLCGYQEIIICCSVFHTDNQDCSEQQNKLPHGEVKTHQDLHLQHFSNIAGCSCNLFCKTHK